MIERARPGAILGEFTHPEALLEAARRLDRDSLQDWEIYSPVPIEGIEALRPSRIGVWLTVILAAAALAGAMLGYGLQYWVGVIAYPINVGGRPDDGWPGFVPTAWEICALTTVYVGFFAFLMACRLPRLWRPVFEVDEFRRASQDRFFLCVQPRESARVERIRLILRGAGAIDTVEVSS